MVFKINIILSGINPVLFKSSHTSHVSRFTVYPKKDNLFCFEFVKLFSFCVFSAGRTSFIGSFSVVLVFVFSFLLDYVSLVFFGI